MSYFRIGPARIRTRDPLVMSQQLLPLSYGPEEWWGQKDSNLQSRAFNTHKLYFLCSSCSRQEGSKERICFRCLYHLAMSPSRSGESRTHYLPDISRLQLPLLLRSGESGWRDLNPQSPGPKPGVMPNFTTPRCCSTTRHPPQILTGPKPCPSSNDVDGTRTHFLRCERPANRPLLLQRRRGSGRNRTDELRLLQSHAFPLGYGTGCPYGDLNPGLRLERPPSLAS